ncbi:mechanosensitive ion channel family protein [Legionella dresdenensis]|uniref:Small-conductance mechanosensitive channel n=1 Tax=Legionella dresdenensis TaxID=450200 RepID=A0ABV8CH33_9GAMM
MSFFHTAKFINILYALGLFLVGYVFAQRFSRLLERTMANRFSPHHVMLISRFVFYITLLLFIIAGLQQLGFNLSVLLGAAGVFTVAISFASQTAASNLVSGIFMLFERPFQIGDNIEVKGISGIVDSIDLLSTKIKTSDNRLVRIPNEAMMKADITNLSYFTTRRIDLKIPVAYNADLITVKNLLFNTTTNCPGVLAEPKPSVTVNNITDSAVELLVSAWADTKDSSTIKNNLQETIKISLEQESVPMPCSQMVIKQV